MKSLIDECLSLDLVEVARGRGFVESSALVWMGKAGWKVSQVYEARDRDLSMKVALKTIRPEISADPQALSRFKNEVQLTRRIIHHNVRRVFDLGHHILGGGEITSTPNLTSLKLK